MISAKLRPYILAIRSCTTSWASRAWPSSSEGANGTVSTVIAPSDLRVMLVTRKPASSAALIIRVTCACVFLARLTTGKFSPFAATGVAASVSFWICITSVLPFRHPHCTYNAYTWRNGKKAIPPDSYATSRDAACHAKHHHSSSTRRRVLPHFIGCLVRPARRGIGCA